MHDLTVGELIAKLERLASEHGTEMPVRIAIQPSWPLQSHIANDLAVRTDRNGTRSIYILESGQVYDAPYAPGRIFSDDGLEDAKEPCDACETPTPEAEREANDGICNACRASFESTPAEPSPSAAN